MGPGDVCRMQNKKSQNYPCRRHDVLSGTWYKTGGGGVAIWLNVILTPRVAYPEIKLQVRDIVRVAGIVAPFPPVGAFIRGKFVFSSFREKMGTGDGTGPSASCMYCCPLCPTGGRYVTGEPGKLQGRNRVRIIEGSCGYRARGVSIRGKFVYRET